MANANAQKITDKKSKYFKLLLDSYLYIIFPVTLIGSYLISRSTGTITFFILLGILSLIVALIWIISPNLFTSINNKYKSEKISTTKKLPFYQTHWGFRLLLFLVIFLTLFLNINPILIVIPLLIWLFIEIKALIRKAIVTFK